MFPASLSRNGDGGGPARAPVARHVAFSRFAKWAARVAGHQATFVAAVALVLAWAVTGPLFRYSDTWQLTINTVTTVATFLMVFVIQNTQTRDTEAIHIKLDELLRANPEAANALMGLEERPEEELHGLLARYEQMAREARGELERRR
jgi:low affinity Fe/Cu permease